MKKRVKCANCGMIYDIDAGLLSQQCPRCKSNAYDVVKTFDDKWKQE